MLENFITSLSEYLLVISGGSIMVVAFYAGLFVALMTTFGSLLAMFSHKMPQWGVDFSLSFAAGVMIVASFTSLILPGIEYSGRFLPPGVGIMLGIVLIYLIDRFVPHEHLVKGYEGPEEFKNKLRVVWLIVLAVIIHNLPEGLAVGTSIVFDLKTGLVTAIAIGIQDFPEGTVVSLPLATLQKKRLQPILMGALSGVAEWVMVLFGAFFFSVFHGLLPYGLGLAGGAMLYVTVKEMIPEIYKREENELYVTLGFFIGFYVMLFLDSILG
ncbi:MULTISPECIES: ZIP family metal transporter [Thermococcus]|uniref:Heavy-metal cation transporter, ZIP family n=2 Tax=Thermococcus sibiricus TaxID=172049 RepID=C5ZZV9_THESM|nr:MULTISPECIES: ZIP family metal transporter [Thermococcus]KUK29158.1 MAG: Heavy-metal cation transporter, ZIP family [Thermococcus sp. 40_45]HII66977.1 ZIP family metal transporter [Thermococcaceae archaeon]ACS90940.1 Heavy-metal cation transporter, ZIP family [Thermococcus sibiricus MM 739]KUK18517.1 MAG: Heavy-metal cation transporter, ZIP family [Thermococcus sibiricus]MBC7094043.1 ZIP family metal transporter [Thermococcus sp.]